MKRPNPRTVVAPPARADEVKTAAPRLVTWIVLAAAVLIPLVWVVPSEEAFRRPKDLLARLEAIALTATILCAMLVARFDLRWRDWIRKPAAVATLAILGWTALTTATSSNRLVSVGALGTVATMAIVFGCSVLALRERRLSVLLVPIAPALVNVGVVVAQYLRLWSPIANAGRGARWQPTGLIGNTNDTGSYLMFVAIPVVALAMASKRWRRLAVIVSVVLVLGIFLTTTLSAVIGLAAGLVVLAALRSFRTVAVIVVICSLLGGMALMFYPPLHERWDRAQNALKEGDYDRLFSYRFAGYLTACLIAADHPVVGLGPGTYGWAYFDYRQRAEQRFPILMRSQSRMFNFAEAHNDHLQVLAQTGFPGLLLLGAAMVLVGRKTFRITGTDERAQFVRYAALPLTTAFGVLALAQFPLELTATTHTLLFFTAAIVAWGDSA